MDASQLDMSMVALEVLTLRQISTDNWNLALSSGASMLGILALGGVVIVGESICGLGLALIGAGGQTRTSRKSDIINTLFSGPLQLITAIGTIGLMIPYGKSVYDFANLSSICTTQADALLATVSGIVQ